MEDRKGRYIAGEISGNAGKQSRGYCIGSSIAFQSIMETIQVVGPRECSVIILGETGVGKELVARQIHLKSQRASKVFVPVDCTALSGHIFESQLFGHVKGSFTGAIQNTLGFFRAADGGTIFLDEIGEISLELQAKLLRVLQESAVTAVGATKPCPVDVRVICATNCDLRQMVREGKFRADLYFRLNVMKIEVPPLRERKEDIAVLAGYFLDTQARLYDEPQKRLSPETIKVLQRYYWPGNVRELANAMEYAYIRSKTLLVEPVALPTEIVLGDVLLPQQQEDAEFIDFGEFQKRMVIRALQKTNGRKMAAARLLKIDHRRLARIIEEFNLQPTWK